MHYNAPRIQILYDDAICTQWNWAPRRRGNFLTSKYHTKERAARLLWWLLPPSILQLVSDSLFFVPWQGGFTQINCNTDIFIGGVPNYDDVKKNSGVLHPFSGSIQKVQLHILVALIAHSVKNCNQRCLLRLRKTVWENAKMVTVLLFHTYDLVFHIPVPGFLFGMERF